MIRKLIAKILIPRKTLYCHHRFKFNKKKNIYCSKPCIYWKDDGGWEYCKYLKKELSIQDQVKDCGINEDK